MSHGSHQATKANPKHSHNNRSLSECYKYIVLHQPIFSIRHSNFTSWSNKTKTKMVTIEEQILKKIKLTQANWLNQSSL